MNSMEKKLLKSVKKNDLKGLKNLFERNRRLSKIINGGRAKEELNVDCREPKFQMTPLMMASLRGSVEMVLFLIEKGANIDLKDIKGNSALQLACMKQRFHLIDSLLNKKAIQNSLNSNGWNCLITAVNYFSDESSAMLLLFLQTGAKIDQKDYNGMNCVDHAVRKNKINCARVILNFEPKISFYSSRALINAGLKPNFEMVLLLLNFGVNPNKIEENSGSSVLHEMVRVNETSEDKFRLRLKIIEFLTLFGASPELRNRMNETPLLLAKNKDEDLAEIYLSALSTGYNRTNLFPKFVNLDDMSVVFPNYPLLKPNPNWTKNDPKYFSSYRDNENYDSIHNLIDGDPHSMCSFSGKIYNWAIFDLKSEHVITKIRIYAWKNEEMAKECFLQVSNSVDGPWCCVQTLNCEMVGSSLRSHAGVPLDFGGFLVRSRYFRFVIANNHGAPMTTFHGIELFGYDCRITKLLAEMNLAEYEHILVENDLNQIDAIINCSYDQFVELPIRNKYEKQKLWDFFVELQTKVQALKKLEWFNEPITFGLVGKALPAFSIIANSVFIDSVQLICHGGGILNGELCVEMEPIQVNDESCSIAIFRNIYFSTTGKFIIEARCTNKPEICISSTPIQIFVPNDAEYHRLLNNMTKSNKYNPKFKSSRIERMVNNHDSDDEAAIEKQIDDYGFPDFSFDNSSKMKINNWLTKSEDLCNSDDNDLDSTSASSFGQMKKLAKGFPKNSNITAEIEYETQSVTIEFSDETSSVSSAELKISDEEDVTISEAKAFIHMPSFKKKASKKTSNESSVLTAKGNASTPMASRQLSAQVSAPPPPPPPPLSPGLLKFKRTKNDNDINDLDSELKNKIAHLRKISEEQNLDIENGNFSLRAKKALEKVKLKYQL